MSQKIKKILLLSLLIVLLVLLTYPIDQTKIVGKETQNACSGLPGLGFRKVRYSSIYSAWWEGLAHYETRCLFWVDLNLLSNLQ